MMKAEGRRQKAKGRDQRALRGAGMGHEEERAES
jgi:hypothetical protein